MNTFPTQTFQLWIAPPAWGKTKRILELTSKGESEFLFISPLRALALEVKAKCPILDTVLPEEILSYDWEELARVKPNLIIIWDEIHLVWYWGESFRPAYLEAWYGFCLSGLRGIGMTATLDESVKAFLINSLTQNYEFLLLGDAGNFSFINQKMKFLIGPRSWREEMLENLSKTIVFCSHRHEVDEWVRVLGKDKSVWGCKGGETKFFQERLAREQAPDLIVATSCLSHGVNLPKLSRVVLLDDQAPWWMIHQMQTRAGRRGESFEIWGGFFHPNVSIMVKLMAFLRLFFRVMMTRFHFALKAWLYGVRRTSYSGYTAKRA